MLSCCHSTDESLDVCIFARFKANCEVTPLRSYTNFKLVMCRHRKELRGALGHGLFNLCVKPSLLLSVSERGIPKVKNTCLMFLPRFPDPGRDRDVARTLPRREGRIHRRKRRAADRQRTGFLRLVFRGRRCRSPERTCAAQSGRDALEEPHPFASVRFVRFHRSVRVCTQNLCVIRANCNQCSCFANLGLNCLRLIY